VKVDVPPMAHPLNFRDAERHLDARGDARARPADPASPLDDHRPTTTLVTGLVCVGVESDTALEKITALGYRDDEVSVVLSDELRKRHFPFEVEAQTTVATGAGVGIAVGSAFGAVLAAAVLVGASFAIPGIGIVVAGPLAAALLGVGAVGSTGGALGTLIGLGISERRASLYEAGLASGQIVIGVHAHSSQDAARLEEIFLHLGAAEVQVLTSRAA